MTISLFLKALIAETAGKFEFVIVGQRIVAFRTSRRADRTRIYTPMQALYAARTGRVRQQSSRLAGSFLLGRQNFLDLAYAFGGTCQNGSRNGTPRRRWVRKLTMKLMGLDAGWSMPEEIARNPDARAAAIAVCRTGGADDE